MRAATWLSFVSVGVILADSVLSYDLQFVTFVHRHGDRSPVGTYPNDPYGNESLWNNGWGELTNAGKRNAYGLGKWLRERYATFLPRLYSKWDYEARSTDVRRTLMSAYLVLAALYEPVGTDVWTPGATWQPVPVHATPRALDNVLASGKPCLRHAQLLAKLLSSEEMANTLKVYAPAASAILKHAGYNSTGLVADFLLASMVFDPLFVQSSNGFQLPNWTKPYFPKPLSEMSSLVLRLPAYTKPLQRLYCGPLVKDIVNHFRSKSKNMLSKKFWHYSAHDITIANLMQCLNFNETETPSYASALILELRSKEQQYYVRILYKTGERVRVMVVPGCTEDCPLEKFEELMKPIIPIDWEAECKPV